MTRRQYEEGESMRRLLIAAIAAIGLSVAGTSVASAQYIQNNVPYVHGSTYYYSNVPFEFYYPGRVFTNNYVGPAVYGPGYTSNYPYMYNQLNYGRTYPNYSSYYYYSPGYSYRWRSW
jgi:hypothetical protein